MIEKRLNAAETLAALVKDDTIHSLDLPEAEKQVSEIMIQLKEAEEAQALLTDEDIHNIMVFVRLKKLATENEQAAKKEKAIKRKKKTKKALTSSSIDLLKGFSI